MMAGSFKSHRVARAFFFAGALSAQIGDVLGFGPRDISSESRELLGRRFRHLEAQGQPFVNVGMEVS